MPYPEFFDAAPRISMRDPLARLLGAAEGRKRTTTRKSAMPSTRREQCARQEAAAYMIAMHTDKVYAARYSLVGSIGTMIDGWDLHKAMERVDVSQRVYASGHLKSMLSPFLPMSKEAENKAKQLVDQGGAIFVADVKATRGARLNSTVDYGSGEIWAGDEAKAIGLVDDIGTLDEVVASTWGIKAYDFGPNPESLGLWSSTFQGLAHSLVDAMLARLSPQLR